MNFDWEVIRSSSVAVSAIIASATFVLSTIRFNRKQISEETRNWQKVVIAEIFQNSPNRDFSFDDLLSKYRSEASAYETIKLSRSQLSKETLRSIIVDLMEARIIEHSADGALRLFIAERYKQQDKAYSDDRLGVMKGIMSEMMPQNMDGLIRDIQNRMSDEIDGEHHVLNAVGSEPGTYRLSDLALKIQTEGGVSSANAAQALCRRSIASGNIIENSEGYLFPPYHPNLGNK